MKRIISLLLLLSFFCSNAQYESATLYFKDGTLKKGLVKKRDFGGIKFKEDSEAETITYDFNQVTGYDTIDAFFRYKNEINKPPNYMN